MINDLRLTHSSIGNAPKKRLATTLDRAATSVLLVNLPSPAFPARTLPLALPTLGSALKRASRRSVSVHYLDLQLEPTTALIEAIVTLAPDVVGLSAQYGTSHVLEEALSIVKRYRKPGSVTLVGGVTATYAYEELLGRHPTILCCVGRGEETICRIADAMVAPSDPVARLDEIPNIAYSSAGNVCTTRLCAVPESHVWPADLVSYFEKCGPDLYDELWIESSRGCPQKRGGAGCTYCAILPEGGSRDWHARPPEVVLQDFTTLAEAGVKHVRLADEEFMANQPAKAVSFSNSLMRLSHELRGSGLSLPSFDAAMRVDDVVRPNPAQNRERLQHVEGQPCYLSNNNLRTGALKKLVDAGLRQVYLGVESGADAQLRRMRKGVTTQGNSLALQVLRDLNIQAACGWIMFDPFLQGADDLLQSCDFLELHRLLPTRLTDSFVTGPTNRMRVLRGTPLLQEVGKAGLLGGLKHNLVEYSFSYADGRIASLVESLDRWEAGIDQQILYRAKNIIAQRALAGVVSDMRQPEWMCAFFTLKRLNFEVCRALAEQLQRAAGSRAAYKPHIDKHYRTKRARAVSALLRAHDSGEISVLEVGLT